MIVTGQLNTTLYTVKQTKGETMLIEKRNDAALAS